MPSTKNQQDLQALKEKTDRAKSLVVTDYAGLTVAQQTKLRAEIKAAGGEFIVSKNTLLNLALGKEDLKPQLQGQTGVVLAYEDEVAPLKALVKFVKEVEKPVVKIGMLAGKLLSPSEVKQYAALPSKDELIVMVMQRLQSPVYGMLNVLQGGMRNLIYALRAIETKKGSSN